MALQYLLPARALRAWWTSSEVLNNWTKSRRRLLLPQYLAVAYPRQPPVARKPPVSSLRHAPHLVKRRQASSTASSSPVARFPSRPFARGVLSSTNRGIPARSAWHEDNEANSSLVERTCIMREWSATIEALESSASDQANLIHGIRKLSERNTRVSDELRAHVERLGDLSEHLERAAEAARSLRSAIETSMATAEAEAESLRKDSAGLRTTSCADTTGPRMSSPSSWQR